MAKALGTIALVCGLLASMPAAASRIVGGWPASAIAHLPGETIRLASKSNEVLGTVSRARVVRLIDVLSRLERAAGVRTELFVVQFDDNQPNAFAASGRDGGNVVGVTPAMLELLGDDVDASAAVFGHELAHLARRHGKERESRQGFLLGLGLIAGILIGARTGVDPSAFVNLGSAIIDRSFSRDEEREADRLGVEYLAASGFDPRGAVRLLQKMAELGKAAPLAFLSTHPSDDERIAGIEQLVASLPPPAAASAASRDMGKQDVNGLVRRGNWHGLLALSEAQVAENPADAFWWYQAGFAQQKLGNHREAVQALRTALEHRPDHPSASINLGFNYLKLEQLDKALVALETAVLLAPENPNAWFGLGVVYDRLGQPDRVRDVHEVLKRLDPKRAERFAGAASIRQP